MDCNVHVPTRSLRSCRFFYSNILNLAIVLAWLGSPFLAAQKVIDKSVLKTDISSIQIDAGNCFEISIENSSSQELLVKGFIDGEYQKDLLVNVREHGTTVMVNAGFQPNFKNPNDKLSAHKVVSIALHIKLPEHKNVSVNGKSCNVTIAGVHKEVNVTLNDGRLIFDAYAEKASIKTQSGDITVFSKKADILATSKYGIVADNPVPSGGNQLKIATVTGNVYLNKIE